ncbi:SPATS2-like protein [Rhinophrynus dorsalis]
MAQADQRKNTKEYVRSGIPFQKRRRSKARSDHEVTNGETKPNATRKSGFHHVSASILTKCNNYVVLQESEESHDKITHEIDKDVTEKEMKENREISGLNTEKSTKDLQRCSVSITRYRLMVKKEVENSVKNIKSTFAELYKSIIDREIQLMLEAENVKAEALEALLARQKRSEELRRTAELSSHNTDLQMVELRAQIKHFVSERKYDEELIKSARLSCDAENLKKQILVCGEISHPKNNYSVRKTSSLALPSKNERGTENLQRHRMRKPPNSGKDYARNVVGSDIASDVCREPKDSANQITRSAKQGLVYPQHKKFANKSQSTRLKGQSNFSQMDDGGAQNAVTTGEEKRGQKNSYRSSNRSAIQNHNKTT